MRFPRRTFLNRLAAWVGAVAIMPARSWTGRESVTEHGLIPGPQDEIPSVLGHSGRRPDRTSAAICEQHLGSAFQVIVGSGGTRQVVILTSVTRSRTIAQVGRNAPEPTPSFSLIFRGDSGTALLQDTYRVEHGQLGEFPLFLVPIGPNPSGGHYQAIFA